MELDDALRVLGNRYQWVLYSVLALCCPLNALIVMGMVFIGSEPKTFYCVPEPGFEPNETVPGYGEPEVDSCHMYEVHDGIVTGNTTYCKHGWTYETDFGETTIVMDFDLVCDDAILVKVAQSILMVGVMFGAIMSGQLADYFGRKPVLYASLVADAASAMGSAWVDNYYAFLVFYFFLGVFQQGVLNSSFVMITEMFTPESRTYPVSGLSIVWGVAVSFVAPISYLLPNWRHFQLFTSLAYLAMVPSWWFVPESTRWLISKGRMKEAEGNLQIIARFNRVNVPQNLLTENVGLSEVKENEEESERISNSQDEHTENADSDGKTEGKVSENTRTYYGKHVHRPSESEVPADIKNYNLTDVIKSPNLLRTFLILSFCWFTNSTYYYGLALNSALIRGNRYVNVFLGCVVELPSGMLMVLCLKWVGRRLNLSYAFVFGSACCIVIAFLPNKTEAGTDLSALIIVISTIGKFWASWSFGMVFIITPEIMPTVIRQVTLGGCSFFARIGGILAPFIIYLGDINGHIPLSILGTLAFMAAFICLILPETRNKALPETIEDGEQLSRRNHFLIKCRSNKHRL